MLLSTLLQEFSSLGEVLLWFAVGGGSMWLIGKLNARLLENITFWHKLKPDVKKIITLVLAGLIGTLAQVFIEVDITQYIPPWLATSLLAAANWYFNQAEYSDIKEGSYGYSTRLNAEK